PRGGAGDDHPGLGEREAARAQGRYQVGQAVLEGGARGQRDGAGRQHQPPPRPALAGRAAAIAYAHIPKPNCPDNETSGWLGQIPGSGYLERMARTKLPDKARVTIGLKVSEADATQMDQVLTRPEFAGWTRAEWCREIGSTGGASSAAAPPPPAPGGPRPAARPAAAQPAPPAP